MERGAQGADGAGAQRAANRVRALRAGARGRDGGYSSCTCNLILLIDLVLDRV